jgi:CDGSH-type Zn-finger protein
MTDQPKIAGTAPIPVEVEEGKTYFWCTCGQSSKQPFCDGSHKDSSFTPEGWKAPKTGKFFFCTCKQTGNSPLCDGSHNALSN